MVICCYTFARWADVRLAIASAVSQEPAPERVVVVVDHNPDLLERMLDELLPAYAELGDQVVVVANRHAQGLSGARNTGLELVSSDVVAFLDDDARATTGWLAAHLAAYEDHEVVGVGGRLEPAWDVERPGWFPADFDWVIGCTHSGVPDAGEIRNPIGANMSFRTAELRAAGGFSEELGRVGGAGAGCEETEASLRVTADGGRVWYVPEALVEHRVTRDRGTWAYFRRRCVAEGRSKATVRELSRRPLGTERAYATRVLPRSFARAVGEGLRGRPDGLQRAAAIAAGLGLTSYGYLTAGVAARRRRRKG
ncbi:glycosyltransferase family 2 protein [Nocardioides mangrovicus]|uniref:Glycosyltransferase family 2 protein n=1 Tax=Nocardioides mangrovicus TaxID=2478913 RepID=A0A3L8P230_9ACTN|nr:glycosyltransferase family 2 protein [Nocardioides mangrovicus]